MKKRKLKKIISILFCIFAVFMLIELFHPTWTPKIEGENSISELSEVAVNGTKLEVMVRGTDVSNPIIIFVHGGPCCSEIPYARKYTDLLEQKFTVVHYDQRGSGKSYHFGEDYSDISAEQHVEDLLALTENISKKLGQDKVILMGHSFGTYIATIAAGRAPEKYTAYVGIGQMSDTIESELDTLRVCMEDAKAVADTADYTYLQGLEEQIAKGEMLAPREYVRKYGHAARLIDENADYIKGFWLGCEYNVLDAIRFAIGSGKYQEGLVMEALKHPVPQIVDHLEIPVYFAMGSYDGMTSPEAAESYLNAINSSQEKELVLFENSAHYPHLEEKEEFYEWMCDKFIN